jgi:outer membrane protein assembly factor BamD (BamD/ComL family)
MNRLCSNLLFFLAVFIFTACVTSSLVIPYDLSPAELIQRAQEASDRSRYKIALQYYEALHERNQDNIDIVCNAEYEIAFIHYKQKKYPQAREKFNNLLRRYDEEDGDMLPRQFKRLTHIVLERMDEKENTRLPFGINLW